MLRGRPVCELERQEQLAGVQLCAGIPECPPESARVDASPPELAVGVRPDLRRRSHAGVTVLAARDGLLPSDVTAVLAVTVSASASTCVVPLSSALVLTSSVPCMAAVVLNNDGEPRLDYCSMPSYYYIYEHRSYTQFTIAYSPSVPSLPSHLASSHLSDLPTHIARLSWLQVPCSIDYCICSHYTGRCPCSRPLLV